MWLWRPILHHSYICQWCLSHVSACKVPLLHIKLRGAVLANQTARFLFPLVRLPAGSTLKAAHMLNIKLRAGPTPALLALPLPIPRAGPTLRSAPLQCASSKMANASLSDTGALDSGKQRPRASSTIHEGGCACGSKKHTPWCLERSSRGRAYSAAALCSTSQSVWAQGIGMSLV